jgi:hypothetical protein
VSTIFRAKYVVVLHQGLEVPVILPCNAGMAHAEIAKIGHAIAAGECELHTLGEGALGFTADGESLSLKLKARPEKDAKLLDLHFLNGGIR